MERDHANNIHAIIQKIDELNRLYDVDAILDKILQETKKLSNCDAGTIFLVRGDYLEFSYVHNDTLFTSHSDIKYIYSNESLPINKESIVGYAALTKEPLIIDDVYDLPHDAPFYPNLYFDQKTSYRTRSMLVIPLKIYNNRLVGVLQLINAQNQEGQIVKFTESIKYYVYFFANRAALAIERGNSNFNFILRMIKITELHDPKETSQHVKRVGSYSAEIYNKWAINNHIPDDQRKRTKDILRLASMLHDLGKVGISDFVLKKNTCLSHEEFDIMKQHTVLGAKLFTDSSSKLDQMAYQVALRHHEKWSGGGYPGDINENELGNTSFGDGLIGKNIPLEARITAIADVYDALGSRRSYKESWPEEKILETLNKESGIHFDPELIDIFMSIHEIIQAIKNKFPD